MAGAKDFIALGARAVVSGIVVALTLGFAALVLASNARAEALEGAPRAGALLLATGTPGRFAAAPSLETDVGIRVSGESARTRVTQAFHNPAGGAVAGIYVLPLPARAAVERVTLVVGERVIEDAKGEARDERGGRVFTGAIPRIGPNEVVRVTLEYRQPLALEDGAWRLRFPLARAPRYVPAAAPVEALPDDPKAREAAWSTDAAADGAESADTSARDTLVNPVDIAVSLDAGAPLGRVATSYGEARIDRQGAQRATVYLAKDQQDADHDFEIAWSVAPRAPRDGNPTRALADAGTPHEPGSTASTPSPAIEASGVDALWARAWATAAAASLPRGARDPVHHEVLAAMPLVLGLAALGAAACVALIGRTAARASPARTLAARNAPRDVPGTRIA